MVWPDGFIRHKRPGHPDAGMEESMSHLYRSKRYITSIVFLTLLMIGATHGISAENTSVRQLNVLGTSVIYNKNLADGRQNAVDDALAAAVGRVAMEMLTNETVVRRFQLINDNILSRRDTYVQNYRVLTESISGNTVRVLVQVDVAADRLSRELSNLGLALAGAVSPRIAFMIAEKNVTNDYTFWWGRHAQSDRTISEIAMAAKLEEAGFEIIPAPALDGPLNLAMNLSQADMLTLGNKLGADIVVFGTGMARPATNTMAGSIQAFQAEVGVEAFNVQTGQSMGLTRQKAVVSAQDTLAGGREALTNAGVLAGEALARQVMAAWRQSQEGSAVIDVRVEGTSGQIASFVKLRTAISSLSGVKELKMKEMAADQAIMAVNYQGTARSLADALLLKTFSGFGVDIYDVTPQAISIRLINN
jgi:hypothetical protein